MNYRDFFKKGSKDIKTLLPEGVNPEQLKIGIKTEKEHTKDVGIAAKIALDHLREDPNYYTKLNDAGLEQEGCHEDVEVDDNGGLPLVGGALAVPHVGQPIHMSKIIQIGGGFKNGPATGELSGYTAAGVKVSGDKEPITAGGKNVEKGLASKTVGGEVVSGEGQKQGGNNHGGTIAGTPKLNESHAKKLRSLVKESLKSIRFDKQSGKWVKIQESVNMKMGPSYKVVQPTQCKTVDQDTARTNQYDPEITEMCDEEQSDMMESRYTELATAKRNLSEAELSEMNDLGRKLDNMAEIHDADPDADVIKQARIDRQLAKRGKTPDSTKSAEDMLKAIHGDIKATNPDFQKADDEIAADKEAEKYDSKFDNTPYRGAKGFDKPPLPPADPNFLKRKKKSGTSSDVEPESEEELAETHEEEEKCPHCGNTENNNVLTGAENPHGHGGSAICAKCGEAWNLGDEDETVSEAGGGVVQHRSFRTSKDVPQDPKARWDNEVDENTEPKLSDTAKKIKKSAQGGKKSAKPDDLKFKVKKSATSKSGVKKQK